MNIWTEYIDMIPLAVTMYLYLSKTEHLLKSRNYVNYSILLISLVLMFYYFVPHQNNKFALASATTCLVWLLSTLLIDVIYQKLTQSTQISLKPANHFNDNDHMIFVLLDDSGIMYNEDFKRKPHKIDIYLSYALGAFVLLFSIAVLIIFF